MALFSERQNIVPKREILLNNISRESRIGLWNVFYKNYYFQHESSIYLPKHPYEEIWCNFFELTLDTIPKFDELYFSVLKGIYFLRDKDITRGWEWYKYFDFLDFVSQNDINRDRIVSFQKNCNEVLEKESSGYRFVENVITPITSEQEIDEIEQAIKTSPNTVKNHLKEALILLSDRQSTDFRNSIKESILAVEAQCKTICEEPTSTLTKSLEIIQRSGHVKIHKHLNEAFQRLYSWTNDDGGIRHALTNEPNIPREDAQFMLIACSAFINYLLIKKIKSTS